MRLLFSLLLLLGSIAYSHASHTAGADLSYRALGNDSYKIVLNLYRDCSGVNILSGSTKTIKIKNTCGDSLGLDLNLQTSPFDLDGMSLVPDTNSGAIVLDLTCPSKSGGCTSQSGLSGYERYVYVGYVKLATQCSNWWLIHEVECCRNTVRNSSSTAIILANELNTDAYPNNSSVINPGGSPIVYSKIGDVIEYSPDVYDPDGDSLSFEVVCPYSSFNLANFTSNTSFYQPVNNCVFPFQSILNFNSITGQMTIRFTGIGKYDLVYKVNEYDRASGNKKASSRIDMQFIVDLNYGNSSPVIDSSSVSWSSNVSSTNNFHAKACLGDSVFLNLSFTDADKNDTISLLSNLRSQFPNATILSQSFGDSLALKIGFTLPSDRKRLIRLKLGARDDACDYRKSNSYTFIIETLDAAFISAQENICRGDTVRMNGIGGSNIQWSVLAGGSPMHVGSNFSCDTCYNVWATPRHSSTYVITTNAQGTCGGNDTLEVHVGKAFSITTSVDDTICQGSDDQISVNTSLPGVYSFKWSPNDYLTSDSISAPAIIAQNKNVNYSIRVRSDSLCERLGQIKRSVVLFPQDIRAIASDTILCGHDTVDLALGLFGYSKSTARSLSNFICPVPSNYFEITNTSTRQNNSNSGVNIPYPSLKVGARVQILFTRNELLALGMGAGYINSISFEITNLGLADTLLHDYRIAVKGFSPGKTISSTWDSNLTEVFVPKNFVIHNGWNEHLFDSAYFWDGLSDLIFEVCFDSSSGGANSGVSPIMSIYQPQGIYNNTVHNTLNTVGACSANLVPQITSQKPVTRFGICDSDDPKRYLSRWFSTTHQVLSPNNPSKAFIQSNANGLVQVEVRDSTGYCIDTAGVRVRSYSQFALNLQNSGPYCRYGPLVDTLISNIPSNILPRPGGGYWSGPGIINDSLGAFRPSSAGIGTHSIKYRVIGNSCADSTTMQVEVKGYSDPRVPLGPYCENDSVIMLDTNAAYTRSYYVIQYPWGSDTSNILNATDTSIKAPTTIRVRHFALDGCLNALNQDVDITKAYDGTISTNSPICPNRRFQQSIYVPGNGGIFSGPGVVGRFFDPGLVSPGFHRIRVDSLGSCGDTGSFVVEMRQYLQPIIYDTLAYYSTDPDFFQMQTIATNIKGGRWSASGTPPWMPFTDSLRFVPGSVASLYGYGTYQLSYFVGDSAVNPACEYRDEATIYICSGRRDSTAAIILQNGKLFASNSGSGYRWFRNGVELSTNLRGIYPDPAGGKYELIILNNQGCPSVKSSYFIPGVGIEKSALSNLKIYPNPTNSLIHLEAPLELEKIELYNALGAKLAVKQSVGSSGTIDLTNLSPGIYTLKVSTSSGSRSFKIQKR